MTLVQALIFTLLAALWGGSFLFMRISAPVLGPFVVTSTRVWLAAIVLLIIAVISKQRLKPTIPWYKFLFAGAINSAIPFSCIAFAEMHINASLASILNATTPLFAALLSVLAYKESYRPRQYIGFAIGLMGVILLVGWSPLENSLAEYIAIAATLIAAFSYAVGGLYVYRHFSGENPLLLAIGQMLGAGLVLLPFTIGQLPTAMPDLHVLLALGCLGIFSTALAYVLYFYLIKVLGASKALTVTYLTPFFGILWAYLFLIEPITLAMVAGLIIILLGIFLVSRA